MVLEPWATVAVEDTLEDIVTGDFNPGLRLAKLIMHFFAIPCEFLSDMWKVEDKKCLLAAQGGDGDGWGFFTYNSNRLRN